MAALGSSPANLLHKAWDEESGNESFLYDDPRLPSLPLKRKRSSFTFQHTSVKPNEQQRQKSLERCSIQSDYRNSTRRQSSSCSKVDIHASPKNQEMFKQAPSPGSLYNPFDDTPSKTRYRSNLGFAIVNLPELGSFQYSTDSVESSMPATTCPPREVVGEPNPFIGQYQVQQQTVCSQQIPADCSSACNSKATMLAFSDSCSVSTAFEFPNQDIHMLHDFQRSCHPAILGACLRYRTTISQEKWIKLDCIFVRASPTISSLATITAQITLIHLLTEVQSLLMRQDQW